MHNVLLFLAAFLACAVEMVEALTIVLAVGITRGWRSAGAGVGAALASLAVLVAVAGPGITRLPLSALRVVVGTVLLIFGNAKVGTPLMQSKQTPVIDLPLEALMWEDDAGKVWLTYNRADDVARRHGIRDRDDTVKSMNTALEALARAATVP